MPGLQKGDKSDVKTNEESRVAQTPTRKLSIVPALFFSYFKVL